MTKLSLSDVIKQKNTILKHYWVTKPQHKKEEKIAKSNDFIFDRENLTINKKGQMKLF